MKWNMQNFSFPMTRSLQDKIDLSPSFSLEKSDQFMQYFALLVIMLRDLFWFTGHVNYQELLTTGYHGFGLFAVLHTVERFWPWPLFEAKKSCKNS